ncbi:hypothetical protein [Ensifer sp. Root127]|uniref:hypothetical protein n=1 Tax=Ensifer sp. Root127 TaxID=1736440 RepID=UPI00046D6ABD|nr:hypothetical protein [Ensifer sp. Root127]KQW67219.1 hypothetical protein ASD03_10030 [Ensifer sp. Root127]
MSRIDAAARLIGCDKFSVMECLAQNKLRPMASRWSGSVILAWVRLALAAPTMDQLDAGSCTLADAMLESWDNDFGSTE